MLEKDYQMLKDGLQQMLSLYDSMYTMVEEENRIIKSGEDLKKLLDTGSKKLGLMRQIGGVDGQLALVKQAWQAEVKKSQRTDDEVGELLGQISQRLHKLLKLDGENEQLLGSITNRIAKKSVAQSPRSAVAAYEKTAGIKR